MYIIAYDRVGGTPIRMPVSQVIVYQDNGTPISIASAFGPDGSQYVSHCYDDDFNKALQACGVNIQVIAETVDLSAPPAGAKLLLGPDSK